MTSKTSKYLYAISEYFQWSDFASFVSSQADGLEGGHD